MSPCKGAAIPLGESGVFHFFIIPESLRLVKANFKNFFKGNGFLKTVTAPDNFDISPSLRGDDFPFVHRAKKYPCEDLNPDRPA